MGRSLRLLALGNSNRQSNSAKRLRVSPEALAAQRAVVRERVREAKRRQKAEAEARRRQRRDAAKPMRRQRAAGRTAPPAGEAGPLLVGVPDERPMPAANSGGRAARSHRAARSARSARSARAERTRRPARSARSGRPGRTLNRRGRLALSLLLIAGALIFVWLAPWFRVHRIRVEGQAYLDARTIETASGLSAGTHALQLINGSAGQRLQGRSAEAERAVLQALPNIQSVTARFVLPSEALLTVELKPASAYLQSGSRYWLIDDAGYAAAELMPGDALPAGARYLLPPLADGQVSEWPSELSVGARLGSAAVRTLSSAGRLTALLAELDQSVPDGLSLRDDIQSVQLSGQNLIVALNLTGEPDVSDAAAEVLKAVRIQVNPDRADCREQLRWLRYALRSGQMNDLGEGVLDLSGRQRVFRPQALLDQLAAAAAQPAETSGTEPPGAESPNPQTPEAPEPSASGPEDETETVHSAESGGTAVSDPNPAAESDPAAASGAVPVLPMN